jgi:hypothetical protein
MLIPLLQQATAAFQTLLGLGTGRAPARLSIVGEDETLFDRRRVERVRTIALPVEWHE